MKFETELHNGNFVISECKRCNKVVWPASEICNNCLGITSWRNAKTDGRIIEFSKHDQYYFCIAEFDREIRILGRITSGSPSIGDLVKITKCGIREGNYFFEMSVN